MSDVSGCFKSNRNLTHLSPADSPVLASEAEEARELSRWQLAIQLFIMKCALCVCLSACFSQSEFVALVAYPYLILQRLTTRTRSREKERYKQKANRELLCSALADVRPSIPLSRSPSSSHRAHTAHTPDAFVFILFINFC